MDRKEPYIGEGFGGQSLPHVDAANGVKKSAISVDTKEMDHDFDGRWLTLKPHQAKKLKGYDFPLIFLFFILTLVTDIGRGLNFFSEAANGQLFWNIYDLGTPEFITQLYAISRIVLFLLVLYLLVIGFRKFRVTVAATLIVFDVVGFIMLASVPGSINVDSFTKYIAWTIFDALWVVYILLSPRLRLRFDNQISKDRVPELNLRDSDLKFDVQKSGTTTAPVKWVLLLLAFSISLYFFYAQKILTTTDGIKEEKKEVVHKKSVQSLLSYEEIVNDSFSSLNSEELKKLQRSLKAGSYYNGEVDGLWGSKTRAAIRDYMFSRKIGLVKNNPTLNRQVLVNQLKEEGIYKPLLEIVPLTDVKIPVLKISGVIGSTLVGPRIATFAVTSSHDSDFYLKLRDPLNKEVQLRMYIPAKSTIKTKVPLGTYEVVYASGDEWYGERDLFGDTTVFKKGGELLTFSRVGNKVLGKTLSLVQVTNGNFQSTFIGEDDF